MSVNNYRKCAKCGKIRAEDMTVTYHRFPIPGKTNITKARAWARYCWPNEDWTSEESLHLLNNSNKVLCGRHFSSSQFYDDHRQKLSKFAVPDSSDVVALLRERDNVFQQLSVSSLDKERTGLSWTLGTSEIDRTTMSTTSGEVKVKMDLESVKSEIDIDAMSDRNEGSEDDLPLQNISKRCKTDHVKVEITSKDQLKSCSEREGINSDTFNHTVCSWMLDSDSDLDDSDDTNNALHPLPISQHIDIANDEDWTPNQLQMLQAEDRANDSALRDLVTDDCLTFNWTTDKSTFTAKRETFTGNPGPTIEVTDTTTPTDIFHRMFDVDFVDTLCTETNRYAQQKLDSMKDKLTPTTRFNRWTPTDRQEMISFLSIFILQGLYPLPNEESYFSFNGFGTMPYFSKIMTYNRYLLLKSMLHFANNDLSTKTRLFKIQPIIDYFNKKFSSLYYPQQEIAIDESLLKGHGRLSFAQKIKTKAAQVGVKTFELCDSSTGYLWQFRVYAGKDNTTAINYNDDNNDKDDNDDDSNTTEQATRTGQTLTSDFTPTNATAKIVFDLIEPLLYRGHTVIMDNFYNCPLLARCLKRKQTDCYGTQRLNREFIPPSIRTMTKTDLQHGELVATYCPDLSLMVWQDSNLVSMISTYHSLQISARNKCNRTTYKPSIVLDYKKNMGGVDRKDQFLSAQPLERVRSRVWYKKLFLRLFNVAVFNCYVIYHTKHTKLSHRQFRTILAEDLLKTYRHIDLTTETRAITRPCGVPRTTMTTTTTTTPTTTQTITRRNSKLTMQNRPIVEGNHFPMRAAANRGKCWWCSQQKVLTRTVWQCIECGVYLCIIGCFRDFHKP